MALDAKIYNLAVANDASKNQAVTDLPGPPAAVFHTHGASNVNNVNGNQYNLTQYHIDGKPDGKFLFRRLRPHQPITFMKRRL